MGPRDVETALDELIEKAMQRYTKIQNIVLASPQGLVIAYQSRVGAKGLALSALTPLLNDAGETVLNELKLGALGEVILLSPGGVVYQVRCDKVPLFVLLSAAGELNVGLMSLVASEIEEGAASILEELVHSSTELEDKWTLA